MFTSEDILSQNGFDEKAILWYNLQVENLIIPGSSAVEQLAVNQLVVGSNPTPGAREVILHFR